MNRLYRHVWNRAQGAFVVTSEIASAHGRQSGVVAAATLLAALAPPAALAQAAPLPVAPTVVSGQAAFAQNGNRLVITQSGERLITNWQSFNVGRDASVQFVQPGANAAALNRVTGGDPSQILGSLSANGQVFLVNPNGIVFGRDARIDAGALVASTLRMSDADFLAGRLQFDGATNGGILNQGQINAMPGGTVALVSPRIVNSGSIDAPAGSVAALAGDKVSLTLAGNRLVSYAIDRSALDALVDNQAAIRASNGMVVLSARALDALNGAVVKNSGTIEARGIVNDGGRILLDAGAAGTAEVSGTLDASGAQAGGTVSVLGDKVGLLAGGRVHADGGAGGGTVRIGGGWHGAGPELSASIAYVDRDAAISATGGAGAGGDVVVWSDDTTRFFGAIDARGASGGDAEVSGKRSLLFAGQANLLATAAAGADGSLLLDPTDITISASPSASSAIGSGWTTASTAATSTINTGDLLQALGYGNVTISTASAGSGNGDITVAAPIAYTGGAARTLSLVADRNIVVNSAITSTNAALGLTLSAANKLGATLGGVDINADLRSNGGSILIGGAAGASTFGIGFARNLSSTSAAVRIGASRTIHSGGGDIVINGTSGYGSSNGNYDFLRAGVYVLSGATIYSGTGNIYITGAQTAGSNTFGVGFEASSGTVTLVGPSLAGGNLLINGVNHLSDAGALGLVNNGSVDRLKFSGITVANMGIMVNNSIRQVTYNLATGCSIGSPYCGNLTVPGTNNSYLYAGYSSSTNATRAIIVSTNDVTRQYDGSNAASGLSLSTVGAPADYSPAGVGFHVASRNVGDYAIKGDAGNPIGFVSMAGGTSVNYAVGYFGGQYHITPRAITVSGGGQTKVYDGTTAALNSTITSGALASGDTAALGGVYASANVGASIAVTPLATIGDGNGGRNYSVSYVNGNGSITARQLTITASDQSRTYGDAFSTAGPGYSAAGLQEGQTIGSVDLAYGGGLAARDSVGSYGIAASGASGGSFLASNYQISYVDGTLRVRPRSLSVAGIAGIDREYDGTRAVALTGANATFGGILSGDDVQVGTGSLSGSFGDANVGVDKAVAIAGLSLSGAQAANYSVDNVSGVTASITPRQLTVSGLGAADKVYDGSTAATITGAGVLGNQVIGDDVSLALGSAAAAFADRNAGSSKLVSITGLGLYGTDAGNYLINTGASARADITPRSLDVSGLAVESKPYDGNTAATIASTGSLVGKVAGDDVDMVAGRPLAAFATPDVGADKPVRVSNLLLGGRDAGNYTLADQTALASINSLPAVVTAPPPAVLPPVPAVPPPVPAVPQPAPSPAPVAEQPAPAIEQPAPVAVLPQPAAPQPQPQPQPQPAANVAPPTAVTVQVDTLVRAATQTAQPAAAASRPAAIVLAAPPLVNLGAVQAPALRPSAGIVNAADGSITVFSSSKPLSADSGLDTKSAMLQLIVTRPNAAPVLERGYDVSVRPGQVNLKPHDKVDTEFQVPATMPGDASASIRIAVDGKNGASYEYRVELRPNGVGIQPLTPEAAAFAGDNSDSVVGSSIVELIQQANVPADRIKTVFLELDR